VPKKRKQQKWKNRDFVRDKFCFKIAIQRLTTQYCPDDMAPLPKLLIPASKHQGAIL